MRVVLNASSTIGAKTGVGRYTEELLRCLQQVLPPDDLFAYPHGWLRKLRAKWKRHTAVDRPPSSGTAAPKRRWLPNPRRTAISALRPLGHSLLWAYDRAMLRPSRFDLYHEPNFIPIACDIPTVVTVHDLSIVRHPEWHPKERVAWFDKHFVRGLRQANHIIADTCYARREMVDYLNIPESQITAIHCGVRAEFRPMTPEEIEPALSRHGLPTGYLLHVGTIEPRKNLLRLMKAYVDLPAALRDRHPLLLVGGWGWHYDETAEYFHSTAKHRGVIHAGYVPDDDLPAIFNGARALVFPTLYEGFGIPVVEMMGCGGAVLASTAGSVAEVAGGFAELIEPEHIDGWRDAMARVLSDDDWWCTLRFEALKRARHFTWESTADLTLGVYKQVLGIKEPVKLAA